MVKIREGESFESAVRRFKKQCEKAGILTEVRSVSITRNPLFAEEEKYRCSKRLRKSPSKIHEVSILKKAGLRNFSRPGHFYC